MYNSRCASARHTVVFGASMGSSRNANSSDPRVGNPVKLALMSRHAVNCSMLVGFRGGRRGPGWRADSTLGASTSATSRTGLEPGSDARTGPFNLCRSNGRTTAMVCGVFSQEVGGCLNRKIISSRRLLGGAGLLMIGGNWGGRGLS